MTDTTLADAIAAHQLELILSGLIRRAKEQLQHTATTRDTDSIRDELAALMALEACRRHALDDNPAPLDALAEAGYRILNNHLEVRQ